MFKNSKTSFKIGGLVGVIILLLGITVMFGVFQMSKVSNEIILISEQYTPLYEIVSEIKFQKSNQAMNLEKILRLSETSNIEELEKTKVDFWFSDRIINSNIDRAKNIVNVGANNIIYEKSVPDFEILNKKLSRNHQSIKNLRTKNI